MGYWQERLGIGLNGVRRQVEDAFSNPSVRTLIRSTQESERPTIGFLLNDDQFYFHRIVVAGERISLEQIGSAVP